MRRDDSNQDKKLSYGQPPCLNILEASCQAIVQQAVACPRSTSPASPSSPLRNYPFPLCLA